MGITSSYDMMLRQWITGRYRPDFHGSKGLATTHPNAQ